MALRPHKRIEGKKRGYWSEHTNFQGRRYRLSRTAPSKKEAFRIQKNYHRTTLLRAIVVQSNEAMPIDFGLQTPLRFAVYVWSRSAGVYRSKRTGRIIVKKEVN